MEKEYRLSLLKLVGIVALIAIIIAIIFMVYPKNKNNGNTGSSNYINNINMMKEAGLDYFKGNNLPDRIGETNKITLYEMVTSNLVLDITDDNGKSCNETDSYVQVTKTLKDEYTMKVYLNCDGKSDYIITSIFDEENKETNEEVSENVSNSNSNVTNNINNNSSNSSNNSGYTASTPTYVTKYNINYVDTCTNCTVNKTFYTVSFNSNGGTNVESQTVKSGEKAKYEVSSRDGYQFIGWYLDGELFDFNTPITKKITLIAKWDKKDNDTYVVSFNSNGGSYISSQVVEYGESAYQPNDPTKDCYNFVGWYTNSSLTQKYNFNKVVTKDITLYAKWEDNGYCNDTHYVRFDSNGGTSVRTQEVADGGKATIPTNPTRSGYTFDGWYLDGEEFNFNTRIYEDITLEAEWIKKSNINTNSDKYNVYFNSNGGSSVGYQTVYEGDRAHEPKEPTRTGYEFMGWYLDGEEFDFSTRIYRTITLKAQWVSNKDVRKTYCTKVEERIYSTGFAGKVDIENKNSLDYTYTLDFERKNISNIKVVDYGNLTYTTSEYRNAYNYLVGYNKPIEMVGNTSGVDPINYSNLMKHSFKNTNMTPYVSYLYNRGNSYYFNVDIRLRNLYNVKNAEKFYTSEDYWVYFVPLYFDIEYADLTDCKDVTSTNEYKYKNNDNYILVDTYYNY